MHTYLKQQPPTIRNAGEDVEPQERITGESQNDAATLEDGFEVSQLMFLIRIFCLFPY